MKNYLFGLGAMLVGAGLMFALTYGGVSASKEDLLTGQYYLSLSTSPPYGVSPSSSVPR